MKLYSSYDVKIKHYNHIFKDTLTLYRNASKFYLDVILQEWDNVVLCNTNHDKLNFIESITVSTKTHPNPIYDFTNQFYKFPSYLRRAVISEMLGKISSYYSNLENYNNGSSKSNGKPSLPKVGNVFPAMYKGNMFVMTDTYKAKIKVFTRNTWDWIEIDLRKSDVDYINKYCHDRKQCIPVLQKRGKQWFLVFSFEENVKLRNKSLCDMKILSVDMGINNAVVCSVMTSDGTILDRCFLKLSREEDSLMHSINRIKQVQQNRNRRTPRLWNKTNGFNNDIAVKTANFIIEAAIHSDVDVIVFENLKFHGKKKGSKRQRLHLWKSRYVQDMVSHKAHRLGLRVSTVNPYHTSKLAYDGTGFVTRGEYQHKGITKYNYSICVFPNGKTYHCDLNASYNIGARYFIREILKSLSEMTRLDIQAKVPECAKRSTCTLSTLINLNAVVSA